MYSFEGKVYRLLYLACQHVLHPKQRQKAKDERQLSNNNQAENTSKTTTTSIAS